MNSLLLHPIRQPFDVSLAPPGSKSLTNRAMVLAALGDGRSTLRGALFADDTRVMIDGLRGLGFNLTEDVENKSITLDGTNGQIAAKSADLYCGNSGTTIRFLTAVATLGGGRFTLDGNARMRERPVGPLVTLLNNLGARVRPIITPDRPPLAIDADGLPGGIGAYGHESSSQYLSAVLQVAPFARHEISIDLNGHQTSWPYIAMTNRLMDAFGHTVELERDPNTGDPRRLIVPRGTYRATEFQIEPDASNATYFLALAALHEGSGVTIEGLGRSSLQGDIAFVEVLKRAGATVELKDDSVRVVGGERLEGVDVDLSNMPDTAQTLAAVALFADGRTTIRGLHTLRVKETDRLNALKIELTKLGAAVEVDDDTLIIDPPKQIRPTTIDTYDDHRMAMSFALVGSRTEGVRINDPGCVSKTYPDYFGDLRKFGVTTD